MRPLYAVIVMYIPMGMLWACVFSQLFLWQRMSGWEWCSLTSECRRKIPPLNKRSPSVSLQTAAKSLCLSNVTRFCSAATARYISRARLQQQTPTTLFIRTDKNSLSKTHTRQHWFMVITSIVLIVYEVNRDWAYFGCWHPRQLFDTFVSHSVFTNS